MTWIIQRGEERTYNGQLDLGHKPKLLHELPSDVGIIAKGDWVWSEELGGFVGYDLPMEENRRLYDLKLCR